MKEFELIEINKKGVPSGKMSINGMLYFFNEFDEEFCYPLSYHVDFMKFEMLDKMKLTLARRCVNADSFYCKNFNEVCEKDFGTCGKACGAYKAKNGKFGVCKHYGFVYEESDKVFELKLKPLRNGK
jgi:hypothetical protein